MNERQLQIRRSLAVLGLERLTNFIRADLTQASQVRAVEILKDALDRGEDLEAELLGSIQQIVLASPA